MLWDLSVRTDNEIEARRPDLSIIDKRENNCHYRCGNSGRWKGESKRTRKRREIGDLERDERPREKRPRERNSKDVGRKDKGDTHSGGEGGGGGGGTGNNTTEVKRKYEDHRCGHIY